MKLKLSPLNRIILLSLSFTCMLLIVRITLTQNKAFAFYFWNIFLGIVPLLFSYKLSNYHKISLLSTLLFIAWLVFFPNAFYIVTDIFHYKERKSAPKWFDLLLVFSAAYNGLLLGIVSLLQVEKFLSKVFSSKVKAVAMAVILLLTSYGIYIGRFLRFNSWDIVANPDDVAYITLHYFIKPWQHFYAWGFIVLFTMLFAIVYTTFKNIAVYAKLSMKGE